MSDPPADPFVSRASRGARRPVAGAPAWRSLLPPRAVPAATSSASLIATAAVVAYFDSVAARPRARDDRLWARGVGDRLFHTPAASALSEGRPMNILVTDAPEDLNFDLQSTTQGDLPVRLVPTSSIPSAVSSVFGRVGAVVAVLGDYAASLVDNDSTVAGATVADALDTLKAAIVPAPVSSVFGRAGVVVAALNDYSSSLVQNLSTVTGATVTAALDALKAAIALNAPFGYFWGANTGAIGATNSSGAGRSATSPSRRTTKSRRCERRRFVTFASAPWQATSASPTPFLRSASTAPPLHSLARSRSAPRARRISCTRSQSTPATS